MASIGYVRRLKNETKKQRNKMKSAFKHGLAISLALILGASYAYAGPDDEIGSRVQAILLPQPPE